MSKALAASCVTRSDLCRDELSAGHHGCSDATVVSHVKPCWHGTAACLSTDLRPFTATGSRETLWIIVWIRFRLASERQSKRVDACAATLAAVIKRQLA